MVPLPSLCSNGHFPGQTEALPSNGAADADDFLARERALLGEDANQFATPQDHSASVEPDNGDDDLLGGAEQTAPDELKGFESSFPVVETHNEVCIVVYTFFFFVCLESLRTNGSTPTSKLHLAARSLE